MAGFPDRSQTPIATASRLADGPCWVTFDIGSVVCPVTVLHGVDDLGQLSAAAEIIPVLIDMRR